jgi:hypothetical protein
VTARAMRLTHHQAEATATSAGGAIISTDTIIPIPAQETDAEEVSVAVRVPDLIPTAGGPTNPATDARDALVAVGFRWFRRFRAHHQPMDRED